MRYSHLLIPFGLICSFLIFTGKLCASDTDFRPGDEVSAETVSEVGMERFFSVSEIPDDIFAIMKGKSFKEECTVPRSELRYLLCLHKDKEGRTKVGEMVLNRRIADDVLEIFKELYRESYPIERMRLVDYWDADDERSMRDNNSSSFNFRFISHTTKVSKHGLGMAVDINPLYNPYYKVLSDGSEIIEPSTARPYVDRSGDFDYKIVEGDLCWKLFIKYGFEWGGTWTKSKDYQHFEADMCVGVDTVALWNEDSHHHKSKVRMYVYKPEHPNGIGVIVCPGGSYFWLDREGEGDGVGEWLSANGITAYVLFYRTPGVSEFVWHTRLMFRGVRYPDMITDAQMALVWAREHSADYSVCPDKTGMMGFSAGGHLVMSSACFSRTDFSGDGSNVAGADDLKPSFVAPIYPVVTLEGPYAHRRSRRGLLGDSRQSNSALRDSLSLEKHIPSDCPPVFLVNCKDDPVVHYMNSVILDSALTANNISHKYIQYADGGHGFGVSGSKGSPDSRQWKYEFLSWLGEVLD